MNVFLGYASEDRPAVRDLCQRLSADGFKPWFDDEDLDAGQDWDFEIRRAVKSSDVFAACVSRTSIAKEGYVQSELKRALEVAEEKPPGTIYIVPIRLEACELPDVLRRWKAVELYEPNGYQN